VCGGGLGREGEREGGREGEREGGREGAPASSQRLSSPVTPWMLDDYPYCNPLEPAVLLQATFSTQHLQDGIRNSTFTMAAEAGSFTGGAAAAEALVGILGTRCRSRAV
jgi:hypothetical protein